MDSAIAFGKWLVDDDAARKQGLEECGRDMEIIRELGGRRFAAPPTGMTDKPLMNLDVAGERYRALLELAEPASVLHKSRSGDIRQIVIA